MEITDNKIIPIHTSDRAKFKECRLAWDFSSILRRGFRPAVAPVALGFGTAIHSGLQAYRDPRTSQTPQGVREGLAKMAFLNAWKALRCDKDGVPFPDYAEEYLEKKELGIGMLENYFRYEASNPHTIVAVEIAFEIELWPGCVYRGKIDAIEEDEYGYWIVDYKTVARWMDEETLYQYFQRNDQIASYAWAVGYELGLEVNGVIFEQLYKGVPAKPARLQKPYKGRWLSTNKNQDTTYELFLEAIAETNESPDVYEDYLAFLKNDGKQYFRRIVVRKTKAELEYVGLQIITEAIEMTRDNVSIYPTPSLFGCRYCDFKGPCEQVMRGEDPTELLNNEYKHTKEHYVDYGSVQPDELD